MSQTKSCEKQDSRYTDIFDTKMDSNLPPYKIFGLFLFKSHKRLMNCFSQSRSESWTFFVTQGCYQKDVGGIRTFFATKFLLLKFVHGLSQATTLAHIINIQTWAPVSCFPIYGKRFTGALFCFPTQFGKVNWSPSHYGLEI